LLVSLRIPSCQNRRSYNPDGERLVEHAFDADHGLEESKPDVDGCDVELDAGTSIVADDNGRVMCGEASGSGAKIGVALGFGDVEAQLCLDTIGDPRADPVVGFRGCIQGQAGHRGVRHPGLASWPRT
jgi:hypothetical protein